MWFFLFFFCSWPIVAYTHLTQCCTVLFGSSHFSWVTIKCSPRYGIGSLPADRKWTEQQGELLFDLPGATWKTQKDKKGPQLLVYIPTKGRLLNIRSIRPAKCCHVVNSQIEYQFGFSRNVLLLASPLFIYASSCFSQPLACCRHNVTNIASVNEFRQLCNCFAPSCLTVAFLGFSMMSCTLEFRMSNL